ncbi:hypothetical protein [Konateibacter massiliensis]|uniref:hypothetical protein n=1 Tax=Konateibacter massiliensis TaxID=2002841 RepID=UPI000C147E70|nr:hypothetical protein [Konateibacter massiliensis]
MNEKEYSEKTQVGKGFHVRTILNFQADDRVKMIYERYRSGRTIIMDDLEYLLWKNPEAFEKLAKSMLRPKSHKGFDFSAIEAGNTSYINDGVDTNAQEGQFIDYSCASMEGLPVETEINISNIIASVRATIENMSTKELNEISRNVYEPLELLKRIAVLKELDDSPMDEKVIYTYKLKKEIDISI